MTLNAGDRLQNYEIRSTLGRGGFGMVYLAHDLNLDIDVALKVIHAELSANENILHRLRTGARTAAKLRHPNIQLVYYMGHDPASQVDFVVMEYLPGGTLRQRLGSHKMALGEGLAVFTQLCGAMEFAHQHGVIHRDLKPENVMYTADGRLVITDFDLAHVTGDARRTIAGQMLGTIAYSSPEQIMGNEVTSASDIYSLGIMLFELITGHHPFTVTELRRAKRWGALPTDMINPQIDLLQAQLTIMPPPASEVNPAVPKHVDAALLKALAKEAKDRYQSAWELACAVNQQPYTPGATPSATPPAEPEAASPLVTTKAPPAPPEVQAGPATPPKAASPPVSPPVPPSHPVTPTSPPAAAAQARSEVATTPSGPKSPAADVTLRQTQKPALRVLNGPQTGQVYPIGNGLSLGNNKARNDVALDDSYASRAHARIDRQGFAYTVTDLASANGTKVNGRRIAPHTPTPLALGDKIEVGYTLMQFELSAQPGPADKH